MTVLGGSDGLSANADEGRETKDEEQWVVGRVDWEIDRHELSAMRTKGERRRMQEQPLIHATLMVSKYALLGGLNAVSRMQYREP